MYQFKRYTQALLCRMKDRNETVSHSLVYLLLCRGRRWPLHICLLPTDDLPSYTADEPRIRKEEIRKAKERNKGEITEEQWRIEWTECYNGGRAHIRIERM